MKHNESKKNLNETQSSESYNIYYSRWPGIGSKHSKKPFSRSKSDYGWDGDY